MAIRSPKIIRNQIINSRGPGHDVRNAVSYHASAILALSVFVLLTSFALALWTLKLAIAQRELSGAVEIMAGKMLREEQRQTAGVTDGAFATNQ